MNFLLVPPSENLIEVVARHLVATEKDYSSNLVLFPGKRPSHFLRKALAERERTSLLPPSILSMDEFVDYVYGESLGLWRRKIEPIDAVSILYQIHATSLQPLGEKGSLTLDTFFPIGMKIYRDLEELLIEAIPPKRVREIDLIAVKGLPEPTKRRLQSLSYFYERFYQKIEEEKVSTRSLRYQAVSSRIDEFPVDRFKTVIVAGFFALTESEKKIFRSLVRRGSTLFIFQDGEGIKEKLLDFGIKVKRKSAMPQPNICCYKSPDTHGEVLGAGTLLREKRERGERIDEGAVIVLPSPETLLPLVDTVLTLLDPEEYNISLGYPLQRTPLFGFFNNLTKVVSSMDGDRLYMPDYLEFILHPYTKNIYFQGRADLTRVLFHAIEEALRENKTKKFLSLEEVENDEGLIHAIKERVLKVEPGIPLGVMRDHLASIHSNTLRKLFAFKSVGDFAQKLKEVIEYIYRNSTARRHPLFYPYSEAFVNELDLLSRSLMKDMKFEEIGSYFSLFKKHLLSTYAPFVGTPLRGIQVLGFLETRNLKFDKIIFLDVNEGVLPDTTREDSLLPLKARQMLGLPTHLNREKIVSYYFDTLIRGAKEVHLFYLESEEKERSRLIERLLWEKQKRDGKKEAQKEIKTIQYAIDLRGKEPQPIEKSLEVIGFLKEYRFSATSLNTYLRCPLRFYYEYVLRLREREVISEEFEEEEIGSFVHRVLYEYFKGKVGFPLSDKELSLEELEKVVRKQFEDNYSKDPAGEMYLLRNQVERHLKDFLRDYQRPKISEFQTEILSLEQTVDGIWNSFRLVARLDRVERRNGRTVIIDYKTTANKNYLSIRHGKIDLEKKDSWREAIGSLQLPFYVLAYSSVTGEKPEAIDSMFLLLGKARVDATIELPLFKSQEEAKDPMGKLTEVMRNLMKEVVDPEIPFVPTTDLRRECGRCVYGYVCTNHDRLKQA